jgi:hypothetical protein
MELGTDRFVPATALDTILAPLLSQSPALVA